MGRKRVLVRRDPAEARLLVSGRVRLWRRYAEISQAQMAEVCGVSRATVQRWERADNASAPSVPQIIAAALSVGQKPADALSFMGGGGRDAEAV